MVTIAAGLGGYYIIPTNRSGSDSDKFPDTRSRPVDSRECIDGAFVADPSQKVVEIYMAAYQWRYSYCSITVYQGQKIKLNLKSLDIPHGLMVEGLPNIEAFISPNAVTKLEFVATKKGEFPFLCNVFCGEGHPFHMGRLIVK